MFNKKLKDEISKLKSEFDSFKKAVGSTLDELKKQNRALTFIINNPSKYKTGDKIGNLLVTGVILEEGFTTYPIGYPFTRTKYYNYWEYTLVDTKTGQSLKKKESELQKPIKKNGSTN
jgi:hypothetical protein